MNKLQKLFNANINFTIYFVSSEPHNTKNIFWDFGKHRFQFCSEGKGETIEEVIEALWQAAKKHYPDAECFKERGEND